MDDKDLMRNIVCDDREAFALLTAKYYSSLCIFAESILGDDQAAKDVVQEAFAYLWEKRRKLDNVLSVRNYLYTSVRNYCLISFRAAKIRTRAADRATIPDEDADFGFIKAETIRLLSEAIDSLPPRSAEVMWLTLEGLRQENIAAQMGISVATVKALKSNGIIKLRKILGDMSFLLSLLSI